MTAVDLVGSLFDRAVRSAYDISHSNTPTSGGFEWHVWLG